MQPQTGSIMNELWFLNLFYGVLNFNMNFKINAMSHFLRSIRVATKEGVQKRGRAKGEEKGRKEEGGRKEKKKTKIASTFLKLRAVQGASS